MQEADNANALPAFIAPGLPVHQAIERHLPLLRAFRRLQKELTS